MLLYLVSRGADPRATDNQRRTLLHDAAYGGHEDVVKYCVERLFIDVSSRDRGGDTALDVARAWGHQGVVEYLGRAEARVNQRYPTDHRRRAIYT